MERQAARRPVGASRAHRSAGVNGTSVFSPAQESFLGEPVCREVGGPLRFVDLRGWAGAASRGFVSLDTEGRSSCRWKRRDVRRRSRVPSIRRVFGCVDGLLRGLNADLYKVTGGAFTQDGLLSPLLLVSLLVCFAGRSSHEGYGRLLSWFWGEAARAKFALPSAKPVSTSAFYNARYRLTTRIFQDLGSRIVEGVRLARRRRFLWKQRWRLIAVDGSRFTIPSASKALWRAFGGPSGSHFPQATLTVMFDVFVRMPIAVIVGRFAGDERRGFLGIIDHLKKHDLLLADRGFPSFEVLRALVEHGIDFAFRAGTCVGFHQVREFYRSGAKERVVDLICQRTQRKRGDQPIRVRLVRHEAKRGEPWVIITSVMRESASASEIGNLYHERWQIEEFFKLWKSAAPAGSQFHSKCVQGIEQEAAAKFLHLAIAASYLVESALQGGHHPRNVRWREAVDRVTDFLPHVLVFAITDAAVRWHVDNILKALGWLQYKPRPGRSFPRRSFAPTPKWRPRGHSSRVKTRAKTR